MVRGIRRKMHMHVVDPLRELDQRRFDDAVLRHRPGDQNELVTGELRDPRTTVLPALAAAGGVVVPAVIFLGVVGGGPLAAGWGIPTATDIAFAVGVLAVLGSGSRPG
jgi:hypothetical protein